MGDGAAGGFSEGFGVFSADLFAPISVVGAATEGGSLFVAGVVDGGVVACVDRGSVTAAVSGPIFE
jgi:hypothetical protein